MFPQYLVLPHNEHLDNLDIQMERLKNKINSMCYMSHKNKVQEFQCTKQLLYNMLIEDGGHFSLPVKVVQLRQLGKDNLLLT